MQECLLLLGSAQRIPMVKSDVDHVPTHQLQVPSLHGGRAKHVQRVGAGGVGGSVSLYGHTDAGQGDVDGITCGKEGIPEGQKETERQLEISTAGVCCE